MLTTGSDYTSGFLLESLCSDHSLCFSHSAPSAMCWSATEKIVVIRAIEYSMALVVISGQSKLYSTFWLLRELFCSLSPTCFQGSQILHSVCDDVYGNKTKCTQNANKRVTVKARCCSISAPLKVYRWKTATPMSLKIRSHKSLMAKDYSQVVQRSMMRNQQHVKWPTGKE